MALRKFFIVFIVACSFAGNQILAEEPSVQIEAQAQQIFDTVFSPFCPGRLLRDCPSYKAHDLKDKIRADLVAGKSNDQIYAELYSTYGSVIRALPETKGFGLFAWLAPILFLFAGALVIVAWLRSVRLAGSAEIASKASLDDKMKIRIEEEMQK